MSAAPSVIRRAQLPHELQYTTVPNAWMRDPALSFKARGLLAHLLSHADGYELSIKSLAESTHKEGREAIMAGLKELRLRGYLELRKSRDRLGTFRTEYVLRAPDEALALPVDNPTSARSANPTRRATRSANPTATRSANPTSIQNPNREDEETQRNHNSTGPEPVDSDGSTFWHEPCPSRWDGTTSSLQEPHRRRRDGRCAFCFALPTDELHYAELVSA